MSYVYVCVFAVFVGFRYRARARTAEISKGGEMLMVHGVARRLKGYCPGVRKY